MNLLEILEKLREPEFSVHIIKNGKPDGYGSIHTKLGPYTVIVKYVNSTGDRVEVSRSGGDFEAVVKETWQAVERCLHQGVMLRIAPPTIDAELSTDDDIPF